MLNYLLNKFRKFYAEGLFHSMLMEKVKGMNDFFFVEIGVSDGIGPAEFLFEYILKYKWHGILVEPVKHLFERLVMNYRENQNLIFENSAISEQKGIVNFYRLKDSPELPDWSSGLGSFHRDIILKHKKFIPNIEDYLVVEKTHCITFEDLLEKHGVQKIDLLQIDTEGSDYKIIKSIDFDRIRPEIIRYEHVHLNDKDRRECIAILASRGYTVIEMFPDTLAYRKPFKINQGVLWRHIGKNLIRKLFIRTNTMRFISRRFRRGQSGSS